MTMQVSVSGIHLNVVVLFNFPHIAYILLRYAACNSWHFTHYPVPLPLPPPPPPPPPHLQALNGGDWSYDPFYLPVNDSSPFSLFEGPNVLAVAASAWPWGNDIFFDMQIAADYR